MNNIAQRILAIMQDVGYVQKDGRNAFHKYRYASEEAIVTKVREALVHHGVVIVPSFKITEHIERESKKGESRVLVAVQGDYTIIDVDSGESIQYSCVGHGEDSGDKAAYKAMAGCNKYALVKLFQIAVGDDPEDDKSTDEAHDGEPKKNKPEPVDAPVNGENKPRNAKEAQFFAAINRELAKYEGPVEKRNEIYYRVLGAHGAENRAEITTEKVRHAFIKDLKIGLGVQ